jgi:hypothetical protein
MTLKKVDTTANSFEANGKKYLIHGSLSVKRFEEFEKLQVQVGFGADFQSLYSTLEKAYANMNQMKVMDAGVLIHNTLQGVSRKTDGRSHPVMLLCTLFIAREGENLAEWTETDAVEKIDDWKKEGIDVSFFFSLANSLVPAFTLGFNSGLENTSPEAEKLAA